MAKLDYKTTGATEGDYSALPAGEYVAVIKSSELKKSKTGNMMLALQWDVLSKGYEGRLIFENLNIGHPDLKVREIAQKSLNTICNLAGFPEGVKDSEQLHNKPMVLKLAVKTTEGYGEQNQIKNHLAYEGKKAASAPKQAAEPAMAESKEKAPWEE